MGRKDKSYSKDLHQQAYDKLTSMQAFGESKKEAMADGTADNKIFSFNTYDTYWKHTKIFTKWMKENYPEITTLKKAEAHVNEWLQSRVDAGLSAWTIQTEAKAMGKLFGIKPDDPNYFTPPQRHRADIKRSRVDTERDKHFSVTNNDELIKFAKGTGLRRSELEELRGRQLMTRDQIDPEIARIEAIPDAARTKTERKYLDALRDANIFDAGYFIHVENGKNGRVRVSPIIGPNVDQIVDRIRNTGADEKVWQHVNSNADIHGYRGDYATRIYKDYARKIDQIPYDKVNKGTGKKYQSEVYSCRKDEAGKKLDKAAMKICSKALGHNRLEVVANNYIRGL